MGSRQQDSKEMLRRLLPLYEMGSFLMRFDRLVGTFSGAVLGGEAAGVARLPWLSSIITSVLASLFTPVKGLGGELASELACLFFAK